MKLEGGSSSSGSSNPVPQNKDISDFVESSYGVKRPSSVIVENPSNDISNKGCAREKRLKGAKEKAVAESMKQKRFCSRCKQYVTGHNSRSCERLEKEAKEKQAKGKQVEE